MLITVSSHSFKFKKKTNLAVNFLSTLGRVLQVVKRNNDYFDVKLIEVHRQ